ncbi:MAG: Lrp/AsnC family transcriptional regulator [Holosporales bacterium]|jgi:DNA-binding Lrp family transcriptional regulator|nr:Lrp/AsnC family transcriptional regulator [Holosporales bacterium]
MARLDEIDIKMLENLQKNGRMTNVDLSKAVGISPPPCLRRLRYLEENGVIKGYYAKVDLSVLGAIEVICIVSLNSSNQEIIHDFLKQIKNTINVLDCMAALGGKDFILRVVVKDYNEFDSILTNNIPNIKGVTKIKTYIVIRTHKDTDGVPLTLFHSG